MLTQLLTMTTTQKFPPQQRREQEGGGGDAEFSRCQNQQRYERKQLAFVLEYRIPAFGCMNMTVVPPLLFFYCISSNMN